MEENKLKGYDTDVFRFGFAHIKIFIDNYYDCLVLTDEELTSGLARKVTVPSSNIIEEVCRWGNIP